MQANPFLYLLQARKCYEKAHRSNNVGLLLLPCPRPLIEVASSMHALFRTLLLLRGDVETNPGLDDVSIAEQLKAIAKDIQDIKKGRTETNQKLDAVNKKLERIGILEKQVTESNEKIVKIEQNMSFFARKVDELEKRSCRLNLIIYGLDEQESESTQSLRER